MAQVGSFLFRSQTVWGMQMKASINPVVLVSCCTPNPARTLLQCLKSMWVEKNWIWSILIFH
jgi:hypothetical protein